MAGTDDDWGCWVMGLAALGGAWFLWDRYEIRERTTEVQIPAPLVPTPRNRPTGEMFATTLDSGEVWAVDADSLRGPRAKRMAWLKADHTEDKTVSHRETATLYEIDCDRGSFITRTIIYYDDKGAVLERWGDQVFTDAPDFAPPGSNISRVLARACDTVFDDPV